MTVKTAITAARAALEAKWHAKYPNGMWYYAKWRDGTHGYGHMRRRPTSRMHYPTWYRGHGYVGRGYFAVTKHRTFNSFEAFTKFMAKEGIELDDLAR